jgi:NRAMP (natural resistance-associated macrophage protein)-like metal ion transporter
MTSLTEGTTQNGRGTTANKRRGPVAEFFHCLGPGLITGCADDDPSGISTYSVAGASLGYGTLWMALFSLPLMISVQLMCARLGMVTGCGLGAMIRKHYPVPVLWTACGLLLIANIFNIGADLGGMADALQMVTGFPAWIGAPLFALSIVALLFWCSYTLIAKIFRWMSLALFAYIVAAFLSKPDWSHVLLSTFVPHFAFTHQYVAVAVAILGTTISPYLFFWQAALEVEEDRDRGKLTVAARRGASNRELSTATKDVAFGMFFSNLVMYFIILTAAATLHDHGVTTIDTARQAAEALRPVAGQGAYLLFTLGLVGTGMLGVPVLASSCAYAIADAAQWRQASLNKKPWSARRFYTVIGVSSFVGLGLVYVGINAVKMLFWSAILNGLLAPPLIILVVLLTSSKKVMGKRVNSPLLQTLGWICAAAMTVAAVALFIA